MDSSELEAFVLRMKAQGAQVVSIKSGELEVTVQFLPQMPSSLDLRGFQVQSPEEIRANYKNDDEELAYAASLG